jgi:Condensation domain
VTADPPPRPLSRAQERMLLAEELLPGAADNCVILAFRVSGRLRLAELQAAIRDVMDRHEALRTVLAWGDRGALQQVLPSSRVALPELDFVDCSGRGTRSRADAAEVIAEQACRGWWDRPFELFRKAPFEFRVIRLESRRHLLCLRFHHLAADGWSGRLIGASLGAAYSARLAGAALAGRPEPPDGPAAYAAWEQERLPAWRAEDLPFWRSVLADSGSALLSRADVSSEGRCVTHRRVLSPQVAGPYLELSRRGRLGRFVRRAAPALASSFGTAQTATAGRMRLGTLTSGRSDLRFRRAVGTFVNPIVLPVDTADLAGSATDAFLDRCLTHARTPFDEIVHVLPAPAQANPYAVLVTLDDWSAAPELSSPINPQAFGLAAPRTCAGLSLTLTVERGGRVEVTGRWRADVIGDALGRGLVDGLAKAQVR